jgi:hypothetical protein
MRQNTSDTSDNMSVNCGSCIACSPGMCVKSSVLLPPRRILFINKSNLLYNKEKETIDKIRVATLGVNSAISPTCYLVPNLN